MKVYFKLNKEFNTCMTKCPQFDLESRKECEKECSKVYDKYALSLYDRYREKEDKLFEEVKDSEIYTTKKRADRDNFWFKLMG